MRLPRPSRVRNVDTDRLCHAIDTITEQMQTQDLSRGELIRHGARRVIMQDELARRGVRVEMRGNPVACRKLFGIPEETA